MYQILFVWHVLIVSNSRAIVTIIWYTPLDVIIRVEENFVVVLTFYLHTSACKNAIGHSYETIQKCRNSKAVTRRQTSLVCVGEPILDTLIPISPVQTQTKINLNLVKLSEDLLKKIRPKTLKCGFYLYSFQKIELRIRINIDVNFIHLLEVSIRQLHCRCIPLPSALDSPLAHICLCERNFLTTVSIF